MFGRELRDCAVMRVRVRTAPLSRKVMRLLRRRLGRGIDLFRLNRIVKLGAHAFTCFFRAIIVTFITIR